MIFVKKWEKKKEMSTKKINTIFKNIIYEKLVWSTFIKFKAISYEENIKNVKMLELENTKTLINLELGSLSFDIEELSEEELLANEAKKLELENQITELENLLKETQALFEQTVKEIYNNDKLNLLVKYLSLFKEFNYKEEFITFTEQLNVLDSSFFYNRKKESNFYFNIFEQFYTSQKYSSACMYLLLFVIKNMQYKLFPLNKRVRKLKRRTKRLLKNLRFLRKLKKFNIFKKKKNYNYLTYYNFITILTKKVYLKNNILVKKIPLSKRVVSRNNLEFFYKLHKHTKKNLNYIYTGHSIFSNNLQERWRVYLRNFHQQPYFKLRKARLVHWSLFYNKTIRKQRYGVFINKFLKKYSQLSYNYSFFFNFFLKTFLSWTRFSNLESFFKLLMVEKGSRILKLPYFLSSMFNWNILKKKNYILRKKIGRWSYLSYKRSQLPWLQNKKNSPKAINHIQPNLFNLTANCTWDVMTNTIFLHKELFLFTFPTKDNFKVNWQIKLHMYRYKANI